MLVSCVEESVVFSSPVEIWGGWCTVAAETWQQPCLCCGCTSSFTWLWLLGTAQQHWALGHKVQTYWLAHKGSSRDQAALQQRKLGGHVLCKQIMEASHLLPEGKKVGGVHPKWNSLTVPRQHDSTSVLRTVWSIGLVNLTRICLEQLQHLCEDSFCSDFE